jgi:hypothetical protein
VRDFAQRYGAVKVAEGAAGLMGATRNIAELQERMEHMRQMLETARRSSATGWTVAYFKREHQLAVEAYQLRVADYQRTGR